jgi:hypothetical protein
VCTLTGASSATCSGTTCSYVCKTGASDCNKTTAPDLDGCECPTPGCCPSGCETIHSDGVGAGDPFYDCQPRATYNVPQALKACGAYAASIGGSAADCSDGWACPATSSTLVCYGPGGVSCSGYCWGYSGTVAGWTTMCSSCGVSAGTWN